MWSIYKFNFQIIFECYNFQAKHVNKVGPEIKVVAENEKDGIISQEEAGEAKDILKLKVQTSPFDMLQTLQWAGGIRYTYKHIIFSL